MGCRQHTYTQMPCPHKLPPIPCQGTDVELRAKRSQDKSKASSVRFHEQLVVVRANSNAISSGSQQDACRERQASALVEALEPGDGCREGASKEGGQADGGGEHDADEAIDTVCKDTGEVGGVRGGVVPGEGGGQGGREGEPGGGEGGSGSSLENEIINFLLPEEVFSAYSVRGRGGGDSGDGGEGGRGGVKEETRMNVGGFVRLLKACGVVPAQLQEVCMCVRTCVRVSACGVVSLRSCQRFACGEFTCVTLACVALFACFTLACVAMDCFLPLSFSGRNPPSSFSVRVDVMRAS